MTLVDERLGLITAVRRQPPQPGMPPGWVGWGAHVAATDRYAPWTVDRYGFGASLGDDDRARRAAIGEAVERYCGNIVPAGLPLARYDELTAAGRDAVDPETLALYRPEQYATPGFPFVPLRRDLRVAWVPGTDLHTGGEVLVPASMAYLNYYTGARRAEPATNALPYAGIATGADRAMAERFALQEVLERDATTRWWAGDDDAPLVADGGDVVAMLDDPEAGERTVRIRQIPSAYGAPVLTAFIEDPRFDVIAFGSACRADPREAAAKALVEAFGLYAVTRKLLDEDSDVWHAVREGALAGHVFRPYRADRSYRDAFRPDLRDLVDLPAIAQLYLDPRMRGAPLDRLRLAAPVTTLDRIPGCSFDESLSRLAAAGRRVVSVDLTTRDVAAAGLHVVRVVVPGLYGNSPPAFPFLGGDRPPIPLA